MTNMRNVKLILWDFDDTLCYGSPSVNLTNILIGASVYSDCECNQTIKEFMALAKFVGMRQGLISDAVSYNNMLSKVKWVKGNYDIELENYCVSSDEMKLGMLKALSNANLFKNFEILIVDDNKEVLKKASDNGFQAFTPMDIVNYMTDFKEGLTL